MQKTTTVCSLRFESVGLDDLLSVLGAVAWLNCPDLKQISQFTELDLKVTRQLLKNGMILGLFDSFDGELYSLTPPYPFKGTLARKRAVVRESLIRMPLLVNVRQFLSMEEPLDVALRKAATVQRIEHFDPEKLAPLLKWAKELKALEPGIVLEDLYEGVVKAKHVRHKKHPKSRVVFLSHHSKDNSMVRQIATDLTNDGISVWLHEQKIHGTDSALENVTQGLVESDFILIGLSDNSVESPWVSAILNQVFLDEVTKRDTHILPIMLTDCTIPKLIIKDEIIDFSKSYKTGLQKLIEVINRTISLPESSP